jgi:D-alanyl-D-alanine carboxypeptidase
MHMSSTAVRRRLLVILAIVTAPVAAAPLIAQATTAAPPRTATGDSVDAFINAEMARTHIPGIALAVVRGGRTIKRTGYGIADLEHGVAVTPQTVFKIGSVSKQFLASAIVLLAQDGKLSIDDSVGKFFAGIPDTWRAVTLRHLLTHTSGIIREGPAFDPLKIQPDSVVIRSAFTAPLVFPTGAKYQYCNVCYFALADIIARVSGKPWDVFLAERIFSPLGMAATRTTTARDLVPNRARGYVWRSDRLVNADEFIALRPSGAFLSTVDDLVRWNAALDDDRVLQPASRQAMWTPVVLTSGQRSGYGFGWVLDSLDGHSRTHHGGSLPGFRAEYARFPADSLAVIVLTNADGANPGALADRVARMYLRAAGRAPAGR